VARAFSTSALAIAAERANAVGAVRLTCTDLALEVELVRVAPHSVGFAPAGVVEEVSFAVPYAAVRALVRHDKTLCLALDPRVASPYNRFSLVRFTTDPHEALLHAYAARTRAKLASVLVPLPLGAVVALLVPSSLAGGPIGLASLAGVVALAAWGLLRELSGWLTWGGPISDGHRDALEAELSQRMGLTPARLAVDVPVDVPVEELVPPEPPRPTDARDPRVRAVLAIGAATALVLTSIAFLQRFAAPAAPVAPAPAERALDPVLRASRVELVPGPSRLPRCVCPRADSPLWGNGLPAMSVLPSPRRGRVDVAPVADARGASRYDFDLALVNNAAQTFSDVRVVVTFARRDAAGERVGIKERGLFWEGELGGGRAVKWRVRAPGTEMRIDADERGKIGQGGLEPAAADAFVDLAKSARYRVVRTHATVMLAYLRDPRATEALDQLGAGVTPDEERTLSRVRRALSSVYACELGRDETACVFNGSSVAREELELAEVAEDGAAGRVWKVDDPLPVHEGLRVPLRLAGAKPPREVLVRAR
jgi:hypothetical protein